MSCAFGPLQHSPVNRVVAVGEIFLNVRFFKKREEYPFLGKKLLNTAHPPSFFKLLSLYLNPYSPYVNVEGVLHGEAPS